MKHGLIDRRDFEDWLIENCTRNMAQLVEGYIKEQPIVDAVPKSELFELFDRITTAWNGKQRFFSQEDGTIYDRNKCDYVKSLDDAVNRFCEELCKDEYALVVHGEWIKYDDGTICSNCGFALEDWIQGIFYNCCPNCGARMKGEER